MKSTTHVWIGIRNVGSSEPPATFSGTLGESLMWLAKSLGGSFYMKKSLQIGIARTEADMLQRLDLQRGMSTQKKNELEDLMASVFGDTEPEDDSDAVGSEVVEPQADDGWSPQ